MDKERKLKLRKEAQALKPTVTIGKNGVNNQVIEELTNQLKKHKLVKVKLLQSAQHEKGKKEIAEELAQRCRAEIIDVIGGTIILFRR